MHLKRLLPALLAACVLVSPAIAEEDDLATEIFRKLIAINTAPSGGNDLRPAMDLLENYLREGGFTDEEITVVAPEDNVPNLVIRYRSPDPQRAPVLMMAHIDVVEGLPSDWTYPPYELTEVDEFYYGRGTVDNKAGGAMLVANFIRLKAEGYEPDRDLIVMLTADEETTGLGATTLANDYRELIDAEYALNTDAGGVMLVEGEARGFVIQTSEKIYVDFHLEALDPGGHSSVPRADSAISRMARTLAALYENRFEIDLTETTRGFFERWRDFAPPEDKELIGALLADVPDEEISDELDKHPYYNAIARTTCIATEVSGGHAINAIPQTATASINCRVLPQFPNASVLDYIKSIAEPNGISVEQVYPYMSSPPSPLEPGIIGTITNVAEEFWPGILVVPQMSTGATDAIFVRNVGIPVYGVSAIAGDPNDARAHGQDERIRINSFEVATEYWYRLTKAISTPASAQ